MNPKRRLFIGDIHGCIRELQQLLKDFGYQSQKDQIISVGDVMGKGPSPLEVLILLKEESALVVRGNHDQAVLDYAKKNSTKLSLKQKEYLDSLGKDAHSWLEYIESWPYFIEWKDIIVVHAGLDPEQANLHHMRPYHLMNIRTWNNHSKQLGLPQDPPWFEFHNLSKTVIFGHWAKQGLVNLPQFKGLDTGCVYGKKLTGYCPEEDKFYQVSAQKIYRPLKINS